MKIKSLILATVVSIIVFTSCDDFLKVNPDDALPPEEALSEQKDLDKALNGMYYTLTNTSFYGCNFLVRGEVGGDDIQPIGQTASRTENYYRFIHRINNSPEGLWSIPYGIINSANTMLAVIDNIPETVERDNSEGEALAIRALCHFNLLLTYGTPYLKDNGGITVSGGEPLLQIDFLIELFRLAKKEGVNTVLDTCGQPFTFEEPFFSKFKQLMNVTDLVLLDIKHIDEMAHKDLTGHTNQNILELAKYLSDIQKPVWIRHVLVPTINTDEKYLERLHQFVAQLKNVERIEVLPYHTLGAYKWKELGLGYPLEGIDPPTEKQLQIANTILETGK